MIKVYTAQSSAMAGYVKNLLESAGLACVIRNEFLSGGMGELPPLECWPEVWLLYNHAEPQARALLADLTDTDNQTDAPAWRCERCGEEVDANFAQCWNCQAPMPDQLG